ncbi:aspartate--tRNA ligase [Candidatus Woesearchaeota archaeon]|nr:aspartate--tRNA ligase [Candidatus Woesearchaeota archaeon]
MKRTHTCGALRKKDKDNFVVLQGWVHSRRDHGGVIFIDLRDRYGLTQIVFTPDKVALFKEAEHLRREDVVEVHGQVSPRKAGMTNPTLETGEVEVFISELKILNKSEVAPIEVDDRIAATDEMRLTYRYLDLRRPLMQNRLLIRHKAMQASREYLAAQGFLEIETPLFVKPTPEGARDYIVPSRVHPGKFYSLPQSPQLYKQLLMVSGCDRYFQLARCLRDEDLRADRQPEFTQIDVEMSFPELEDIYTFGEGVIKHMLKKAIGVDVATPFPRIPHKDAMAKYGCDKPDLRFELFLHDVTDIAKESEFSVFKSAVESGMIVKCICPQADFSRKDIDELTSFAVQLGAKGMAWMRVTQKGLESSVVKYFNEDLQKKLLAKTGAKPGSTIFFIADTQKKTNDILAKLRLELGKKLNLIKDNEFKFCWVTDFPLFEWNEEEEKWDPAHHPFCMPIEEHLKFLEIDPGKVYCTQYDMALNGVEILSGSIRIHSPDIQERVMKVIGISKQEIEKKFGFLLEAFKYGAPPHGGFAFGFDRIVALMCGINDIREVIAFPKNKSCECPMDGSPSEVPASALKELHIKTDVVSKK